MAGQTPDQIAKQMGFPSAAAMMAWQERQRQIQQLPAQTMAPSRPQQAAPQQTQSWLDTILSYLPFNHSMSQVSNTLNQANKK